MTGSVLLTTSSRPLAKFHPNVWGDCFLLNTPQSIQAGEKQIVEELKEDVRRELKEVSNDYLRQLKMVDAIQRLGVEYHFEEEIDEALQNLFKKFKDYCKNKHDMYVTALSFRLLRQHGYRVSCQIFDEFMDDEDGFKVPEVNAVLEFFEATHLRIQGEDVLDQGVVFSRNYLESILPSLSNPVAEQVRHALFGYSNRRALPRVEARKYIPIYEQYASHHQGLLKLAKLDFNMLQSMHRRELSEISRWWKGLEVATKLPFVRDRLVETYFWDAGVYFEPQYAVARMILTKVQYLLSIIDDISDAYATLEELQIFADAIQRSYILHMCVYHWEEKYKPKSQEYMLVATESSGYITVTIISLLGMRKDVATREVFDWVVSRPHVMRALLAMCRLNDDIAGHEFEQKREHIPSAVECYSEEHNVSKEEAVYEFKSRIECAWKDINEAFLRPTKFPTTILYRILNLARAMEVLYSKGDWYTNVGPEMQTLINHLYIHPLS